MKKDAPAPPSACGCAVMIDGRYALSGCVLSAGHKGAHQECQHNVRMGGVCIGCRDGYAPSVCAKCGKAWDYFLHEHTHRQGDCNTTGCHPFAPAPPSDDKSATYCAACMSRVPGEHRKGCYIAARPAPDKSAGGEPYKPAPCPAVWDCYADGAMRCCREDGHEGWHRPSVFVWEEILEISACAETARADAAEAEVERLTAELGKKCADNSQKFIALRDEKARADAAEAELALILNNTMRSTGVLSDATHQLVPLYITEARAAWKARDAAEAEVARLTRERDEANANLDAAQRAWKRYSDAGLFSREEYEDNIEPAEARVAALTALLRRIDGWDHMDTAGDGPYWRSEIRAALEGSK